MWVEPDKRDSVVDFVTDWGAKTELPVTFFIRRMGISRSKFSDWKTRYGTENRHNGAIPRDFWLEDWEKEAIIDFYVSHPREGYRRCCYMMIDRDLVAVSPATVYRVLSSADMMRRWKGKSSRKGQGFSQPSSPHEHWHVDVSYVNICGTFYYLCSVLDGYSRHIVHWEIRECMKERDVAIVIQRAGAVPWLHAPDHQRQWSPVDGPRLQGVHPHQRHDACAHVSVFTHRATVSLSASTGRSSRSAFARRHH